MRLRTVGLLGRRAAAHPTSPSSQRAWCRVLSITRLLPAWKPEGSHVSHTFLSLPFSLSVSLLVSHSSPPLLSSISFHQASLSLSHHSPFLLCLLVLSKAQSAKRNSLLTISLRLMTDPVPRPWGLTRRGSLSPWASHSCSRVRPVTC